MGERDDSSALTGATADRALDDELVRRRCLEVTAEAGLAGAAREIARTVDVATPTPDPLDGSTRLAARVQGPYPGPG